MTFGHTPDNSADDNRENTPATTPEDAQGSGGYPPPTGTPYPVHQADPRPGAAPWAGPAHDAKPNRLRWIAAGSAAALLLAAGGFGIGYAAHPGGDATASGPQVVRGNQGTSPFGDGTGEGNGYQGYQGTGPGWQGTTPSDPQGGGLGDSADSSSDTTSKATDKQLTGLVRIQTVLGYQDGEAAGTGMVLTSDGEVITNHHVVEGATKVTATVMSTGKSYTATVVGTDADADVAVLQLQDASGLSTVKTDTGTVKVGDKVTAVGDAGGSSTTFTAATGSVEALNQPVTTSSGPGGDGESLTGTIQISSDVISGDSGGATYDADGEVIGMTTAASTGTEVNGYAIPISKVLDIADDLSNHVTGSGYAYGSPAFLGIGLSRSGTAPRVESVYDGTAAAKAGIGAGDTITKIGGTSVSTASGLQKAVAGYSPGDRVSITWTDADGSHTATVTLGSGPIK